MRTLLSLVAASLLLSGQAFSAATHTVDTDAPKTPDAGGDIPAATPAPPGFCGCKWNDPSYHTPKYDAIRILSAFPHTPNGLKAGLPALRALYPGTVITRELGDKIDVPCVGKGIDVIVNSGGAENPDAGDQWAWQVPEGGDLCGTCSGAKKNICNPPPQHHCSCECDNPKPAFCSSGTGANTPAGGDGGVGGLSCGDGSGRLGDQGPHTDVVAQAKADLQKKGIALGGSCGAFSIVKLAACRLRGTGAGLLSKPSGNNCQGFATDIIAYPDGHIYDVLIAGGESNTPGWQDDDFVDPSRYRPAIIDGTVPGGTSSTGGSSSGGSSSGGSSSGGSTSGDSSGGTTTSGSSFPGGGVQPAPNPLSHPSSAGSTNGGVIGETSDSGKQPADMSVPESAPQEEGQ